MVIGGHPWAGHAGTLIAYEKYGLGWYGWRVKLDENCGECYAREDELSVPRVDSIKITYRKRKVKR
jgi:hypothetical protein